MLVAALLSALLANDIVCLAFTPVLCLALLKKGLNPLPFLLGLAAASNIGSAATIIGNPQNHERFFRFLYTSHGTPGFNRVFVWIIQIQLLE